VSSSEAHTGSTWPRLRLGDLCEILRGVSYKKDQAHDQPSAGLVPILRATNIQDAALVTTSDLVYVPADAVTPEQMLRLGDIVVATSSGSKHLVGKTAQVREPWAGSFGAFCATLRPKVGINHRYLGHFFESQEYKSYITKKALGVNINNLRRGDLQQIEIPVAPLDEQARIVAEIEKQFSRLDEAIASLKRSKASLKRYKGAVLKAAVEGRLVETEAALARRKCRKYETAIELLERTPIPPRPNRFSTRSRDVVAGHPALSVGNTARPLPEGWSWSPLVDIARMESGHTPSRRHPEWWDGPIPWIGIADAREHHGGEITDTAQHTNDAGIANSAARLLPRGTVCVSRTASVGYVVVMGRAMATSQDFVNWIPTPAITSDWLRIVFLADREALIGFGKGSVHKTIYFPEWLSVHIAVPPIEEQRRIALQVDQQLSATEATLSAIESDTQRASALRRTILANVFRGGQPKAARAF
jgi:type I restriction enzyme S subunit